MTAILESLNISDGGTRQAVTVLFCDLCQSSAIAAALDPETYAEFLQALNALIGKVVAQNDGVVARVDGDGALCIFGLVASAKTSTRQAIETALKLNEQARNLAQDFVEIEQPIRLHSGINTGVVFLKEGDIVRGRFEVLGDVTNVAARLCDHAQADWILISQNALGADRRYFDVVDIAPLKLHGKVDALKLVNIGGIARDIDGLGPSYFHSGLKFIGREYELSYLHNWLSLSGPSSCKPLVVHGPAGIGKSRLIGAFTTQHKSGELGFFQGSCEARIGSSPLQPFYQIFNQLALANEIDGAKRLETLSAQDFALVFGEALERVVINRPTVCIIEDWHWASDLAQQFLSIILIKASNNTRFLLTSRTPDLKPLANSEFEFLDMQPWSTSEIWEAVFGILHTKDIVVGKWLSESSGGNPLYLQEICYGLLRGEVHEGVAFKSAWLESLIQSRFARLPPSHANLLQAAAVLGHVSPLWLFEAMVGNACDDAIVFELAAADFLFVDDISGTIRFKHGITRDAVYTMISPALRRKWHAKAVEALLKQAESLGDDTYSHELAYHTLACGQNDLALKYALKVGGLALGVGSLDRAQAHFQNAFTLALKIPDAQERLRLIWKVTNKYGLACIVDPHPSQLPVMSAMVDQLEKMGSPRQRARGAYWLGTLNYGLGRGRTSVRYLESAFERALEIQDKRLVQQVEVKLTQSFLAAGNYELAEKGFAKAYQELDAKRLDVDEDSQVYFLSCYGLLLAYQGDFRQSRDVFAAGDRIALPEHSPSLASVLANKAVVAVMFGDWEQAIKVSLQCLSNATIIRTPYQVMCSEVWLVLSRWKLTGDHEGLKSLANSALWFETGSSMQRTSLLYANASVVFEEAGQTYMARKFAVRAILRSRRDGDDIGAPVAYRTLAKLNAREGRHHQSRRNLNRAYRESESSGSARELAMTQLVDAEISIWAGRHGNAADLLRQAKTTFDQIGADYFSRQAADLARSID